ncbi:hypothetical protein EIK76_13785 [Rheinheimera mesophila]|uniref:DUF2489 domain-containing protein n=1 Tax=Rheinheimera mesophila TaxID=1547515 RepID=A0A3P3QGA0_9GAMM|nr:hypothetical protein [Rheinheimera mesophila]KKL03102.1 hypothetical protein SD53_01660 [Rheinheimera mesophila]RRJ19519.1 hypothetical protein EIK76_13785 [Rheinheimera mesophila]
MDKPDWVTNEASWIKTCKKVVARARDLEENRIGVIVCAREMCKLAFWLRAEDDQDFKVFRDIDSDSAHLPAGQERQRWAQSALQREDVKIAEVENAWHSAAIKAAQSLKQKYESHEKHT